MKHWPFLTAIVMLSSTLGFLQSLSHEEPVHARKPFATFPLELAGYWQGRELGLDEEVLEVLKLSDYMMRVYVPVASSTTGSVSKREAPVYLYVGFYESQRSGSTYHSPKNCLPGAGWQMIESQMVTIPVQDGREITINHVLIQKGTEQQVILYWYHDRGRVIASEYWAKGYMVWDAMTHNRTDGALVRVSIPVTTTSEAAFQEGARFVNDLWPVLLEHMPSAVSFQV